MHPMLKLLIVNSGQRMDPEVSAAMQPNTKQTTTWSSTYFCSSLSNGASSVESQMIVFTNHVHTKALAAYVTVHILFNSISSGHDAVVDRRSYHLM